MCSQAMESLQGLKTVGNELYLPKTLTSRAKERQRDGAEGGRRHQGTHNKDATNKGRVRSRLQGH